VVRDRENTDLIPDDGVDDAERESARDQATPPVSPHRAETWVLQEQSDGALELGKEGLR
jgi:hypothetical protein